MTRRWLRIWSLGDCYFCVSDKTHLSHAVHPSIQENLWESEKKNCQRMLQRTSKSSARWSNNSLGPFMTRKLSNVWQICSRIDGILCLIRLFFQILRKGNPPLLRMRMSFRKVFLVLSGEYLKVIFTRDAIGRRYFFLNRSRNVPNLALH